MQPVDMHAYFSQKVNFRSLNFDPITIKFKLFIQYFIEFYMGQFILHLMGLIWMQFNKTYSISKYFAKV